MTTSAPDVEFTTALARSTLYRLLAKSFLYPTQEVFDFIRSPLYEENISRYLDGRDSVRQELITPCREELEREYNRLFAHLGSAKCPPYETEYGYDNIFQKTEAMADIAGFYRAYELEVGDTNTERVDFISTELEFMAYLALKEAYAREQGNQEHLEICVDSQQKFLRDHLGRWISIFSKILSNSTDNTFYKQLATMTANFLDEEARTLGIDLDKVSAPDNPISEVQDSFVCDGCTGRRSNVEDS